MFDHVPGARFAGVQQALGIGLALEVQLRRVRVLAAGVQPFDVAVRQGQIQFRPTIEGVPTKQGRNSVVLRNP